MKRFLCVILVFTLFIACTVRPAYAVDVGTVSVALEAFISAALIGLGLSPQAGNNTSFNQIVSNCKEWLQTATIEGLEILDTASGLAISLISPVDGAFYVRKNVIEEMKDWLFSSNTIKPSVGSNSISTNFNNASWVFTSLTNENLYPCIQRYKAYSPDSNTGETWLYHFNYYVVSYENFSYTQSNGSGGSATYQSSLNFYYTGAGVVYSRDPDFLPYDFTASSPGLNINLLKDFLDSSSIVSPYPDGISVSEAAPKYDEELETNYPTWADHKKIIEFTPPEPDPDPNNPDPDENPIVIPLPYLPVWHPNFSNPGSQDDLDSANQNVSQTEVWQNGATNSWPSDDITSNPSGKPPSLPEMAVDLREFFPFCIPFDIYNLVTLFVAEPVAPVFEWEIPVPRMGKSFELEIDLSAWDGIAKLFRTFELIGFIIGLGWITREKILRG